MLDHQRGAAYRDAVFSEAARFTSTAWMGAEQPFRYSEPIPRETGRLNFDAAGSSTSD
jgi:hypothetical protein